jgi:predicted HNH restriction endonuclease
VDQSEPIASCEQYQAALAALRKHGLQASDMTIIRAFCTAPEYTLTTTQLARACGFSTCHESSVRFDKLAERLGKYLAYVPGKRKDGTVQWWRCAAVSSGKDERSRDFAWALRRELVAALHAMKWVQASG